MPLLIYKLFSIFSFIFIFNVIKTLNKNSNLLNFVIFNYISKSDNNVNFLFKKYTYFLKKKRSFINNFIYINVIKGKNIYVKNNSSNLIDYKKKIFSLILENRKLINFVFFNNTKSFKLTKKIWLLLKFNIREKIDYFNNQLWLILLKSNLVISKSDLSYLLSYNMILVNYSIINKNLTLKCNDLISLVYNKFYFFYLSTRVKSVDSFIRKFKKKYLNINSFFLKSFILLKEFKQKKLKIFKYLFFFKNFRNDYLEIDYNILSIYILKSYFEFSINYLIWKKIISVYLLKLYNWKYIN